MSGAAEAGGVSRSSSLPQSTTPYAPVVTGPVLAIVAVVAAALIGVGIYFAALKNPDTTAALVSIAFGIGVGGSAGLVYCVEKIETETQQKERTRLKNVAALIAEEAKIPANLEALRAKQNGK